MTYIYVPDGYDGWRLRHAPERVLRRRSSDRATTVYPRSHCELVGPPPSAPYDWALDEGDHCDPHGIGRPT